MRQHLPVRRRARGHRHVLAVTINESGAWGDPEHPMDAAALRAKFDRLTYWAGVPGSLRAELAATVLALPATGDAAALTACLHRIPATARR